MEPNWKEVILRATEADEFDVSTDNFSHLAIREGGTAPGFHYFFDATERNLIKHFVLKKGAQVDTMCDVTLIKKDDRFSPRLKFWKKDKTKPKGAEPAYEKLDPLDKLPLVKSAVDTSDARDGLWKLLDYLRTLKDVDLPDNEFRIASTEQVELGEALAHHDKQAILEAVRVQLGGSLTEADIALLSDRRTALERFRRMLAEPEFFEAERLRFGKPEGRRESVWQQFFEDNVWIFGYGLSLIACEPVDAEKLEKITTGANVFSGGGKRIDAVMRTRGFIQSLMFAEIKLHDDPLLKKTPYRDPDVYEVSRPVSGGVSQVQKTAHKSVKALNDLHQKHSPGGDFEFELATIRPRQTLVVGNLSQLSNEGRVNTEKLTSFELYRRQQQEVEILTFDELYQRACFIVDGLPTPGAKTEY